MNLPRKFQLSTVAIALMILACIAIDLSLKNWKKQDRVIEWDVHWYYAYLPAVFIFNDIKLEKDDHVYGNMNSLIWTVNTSDGKKVIKTTMGMSILYSPFFFVAHGFALLTDYPENGESEPYKIFLLLSAIFYLYIGLEFVRKILRRFSFSDIHITIVIFLLGMGTNLLCYSSQSAPMSHVYSFSLFAIFMYYTMNWYERQSTKNTIILGLLLGLITLVRPSNIVILIFFLLYKVDTWKEFKERMLLLKNDYFLFNVIFFIALLAWVPQFIYWKVVTGNYICYSYTEEGFFFANPKIIDGLFSFRKGWLLYAPLMAFSLIGIFFMKDAVKKLRLPIVVFFFVNIYIIFSWWCWWYGGSYGQRSMIDSYALLALPFASFISFISTKKIAYKICFYAIALFFIWLNIFQTYQFEIRSLHWDGMTKELYFNQFGKLRRIADFDKYVKEPDDKAALRGISADLKPQISVKKPEILNTEIKIRLKAANNKYLSADRDLHFTVIANRDNGWEWETFTIIPLGKNLIAFRAYNGRYLTAELNDKKQITATRETIDTWEQFNMVKLDSNIIALKAANGKYIIVDPKTFFLIAKSDNIDERARFRME